MPMMPYDVCLATPTYFGIYGNVKDAGYRKNLFLNLRDSMKRLITSGAKVCWLIQDDASPESFPEWNGDNFSFDIQMSKNEEHLGMPKNYLNTAEQARQIADWVLVVDDDAIVAPNVIHRMFELANKYPDHLMYGAFNSPYHKVVEDRGDHVLKHSTCELGRFFRHNYEGFGFVTHPIAVLKPSGIQHCGTFGLNGTADDFDPNF